MHNITPMNKSKLSTVCGLVILFALSSNAAFAQNAYTKICLEAISLEKAGRLDEAVNKYTEAINMKPGEWTGYSYRAKVNYQRAKYDEAITDASKAITLSPQTLSIYAVRANSLEAKGMYDRALDDYNMALSKTSNNDKEVYLTYFQRGRTYFLNKKYEESVIDFGNALASAKKFQISAPEIYSYRAQAYSELHKYSDAVRDFETYSSARPNDVKSMLLQGYSLIKNGESEKAKQISARLLQIDPSKEIYFSGNRMLDIFNLDLRREKSKKLTSEAQILISEQSMTPSRTLAGMKLSDAFKSLDTAWLYSPSLTKEDQVLRDTIMAGFFKVYPLMKVKPEISEQIRKFVVQANSATQDKKYDDAIGLWTTSLNMAPYFPLAYYNRALLHELKGNIRYSISDMEKYLKLVPDAADARSARDRIYAWEGKLKDVPAPVQNFQVSAVNQIEAKSYSPGNFIFSVAIGGSFGVQFAKNKSLTDLWDQSTQGATPDHKYSDDLPFMFSGDAELTVRPVKRVGIGAFGKLTGGVGTRTTVSSVKYIMDMGTAQYGGFVRGYLLLNNGAEKPDVYVQYGYGRSTLTGYYAVATMDGIIFDYSYMNHFNGTAPLHTAGVGMGGKLGKNGYLTLSLDYLLSKFKGITYEVTTNVANQADVGSKGDLISTATGLPITMDYNGFALKMIFGFCF
jgi:tetratricopeptide (TPR) repeat protein